MSKYNAKPTRKDGIYFASQIESQYYEHLKQLERAKQIAFFVTQPKYVLQEKYKKNGETIRAINYVADFEVTYPDGRVEIIDVKGKETDVFKIKKKIFEYRYPGKEIICVNHTNTYGWETLKESEARKKGKKKK